MRYVAVKTQSPQNFKGKLAWNLKVLTTFKRCLCFLSTTAFCYGVSTQDSWWMIPLEAKKEERANLGPLSNLNTLIGTLNWVKIIWKKDGIKVEASDLCFNKYTQVHLLWSSTKVRKYFDPFKERVEYGPQMSAWTKSKQDKEMLEEWVKGNLCYLAKGQMWK